MSELLGYSQFDQGYQNDALNNQAFTTTLGGNPFLYPAVRDSSPLPIDTVFTEQAVVVGPADFVLNNVTNNTFQIYATTMGSDYAQLPSWEKTIEISENLRTNITWLLAGTDRQAWAASPITVDGPISTQTVWIYPSTGSSSNPDKTWTLTQDRDLRTLSATDGSSTYLINVVVTSPSHLGTFHLTTESIVYMPVDVFPETPVGIGGELDGDVPPGVAIDGTTVIGTAPLIGTVRSTGSFSGPLSGEGQVKIAEVVITEAALAQSNYLCVGIVNDGTTAPIDPADPVLSFNQAEPFGGQYFAVYQNNGVVANTDGSSDGHPPLQPDDLLTMVFDNYGTGTPVLSPDVIFYLNGVYVTQIPVPRSCFDGSGRGSLRLALCFIEEPLV